MKQVDRELLYRKELCSRLPYGVVVLHEGWNYEWDQELSTLEKVTGIDEKFIYTEVIGEHSRQAWKKDQHLVDASNNKLCLRPMESMTEEEYDEFFKCFTEIEKEYLEKCSYSDYVSTSYASDAAKYDWLNKKYV